MPPVAIREAITSLSDILEFHGHPATQLHLPPFLQSHLVTGRVVGTTERPELVIGEGENA